MSKMNNLTDQFKYKALQYNARKTSKMQGKVRRNLCQMLIQQNINVLKTVIYCNSNRKALIYFFYVLF